MPKSPKKNVMSSAPTWASVVANGIRNGPTYPNIPMPDKSLPWNRNWHVSSSETNAKRALPAVMSSTQRKPDLQPSRSKEPAELPTSKRTEQQPIGSRRTLESDDTGINTSYPNMNTQAYGNRARRHPRCPAPMNWRSRGARHQLSRTSIGSLLEPDKRYVGVSLCPGMVDNPDVDLVLPQSNQSDHSNNYDNINNYRSYRNGFDSNYNNNNINGLQQQSSLYPDPHKRQAMCTSPRERNRCQVTFVNGDYSAISWQMVGNSRQVWEPLLPNQRSKDPSNPMRECEKL